MTSPHRRVPGRDDRSFEYVHRELDREVTAIGGHYRFDREAQIAFRGQQVLYLCGYALYDTSCCGLGGMRLRAGSGGCRALAVPP